MANFKRILDEAVTFQLERSADLRAHGFSTALSARARGQGSAILARAFDEELISPELFSELINDVSKACLDAIFARDWENQASRAITEKVDPSGDDDEQQMRRAARLTSLGMQIAIHIGAEQTLLALLKGDTIKHPPQVKHLQASKDRKLKADLDARRLQAALGDDAAKKFLADSGVSEVVGPATSENYDVDDFINEHLRQFLRDPRDAPQTSSGLVAPRQRGKKIPAEYAKVEEDDIAAEATESIVREVVRKEKRPVVRAVATPIPTPPVPSPSSALPSVPAQAATASEAPSRTGKVLANVQAIFEAKSSA